MLIFNMVKLILVSNIRGCIEGDLDDKALDEHLSFRKSQFWWKSAAARSGQWDGKTHLYNRNSRTFPLGLLKTITRWLKEHGIRYRIKDQRPPTSVRIRSGMPLLGGGVRLRVDQKKAVKDAIRRERGIIHGATGSGKTEIAAAIIKKLDIPITIFVTGRKKLARQTRERFALRLNVGLDDIGFIQGGKWEEGTTGVFVVVIDSLISKKFTKERSALYKSCELLIIDEAHHTGSSTWYRTLMFCRARYRFGLTGTPVGRSDSGDLYLRACTGDVVAEIRASDLIESGVLAKPEIYFVGIDKPDLTDSPYSWAEVYNKGITNNAYRNGIVVDYAKQLQRAEKKTLILVREITHGGILELEIPKAKFLHGSLSDEVIDNAVSQFETGEIRTLIATSIFDEGIDIPSINALILATGGKSAISTLQRIGRGLRKKQGDNRLFVFDFEDRGNEYLKAHSQARVEVCKKENFNIHFIEPDKQLQNLIKK